MMQHRMYFRDQYDQFIVPGLSGRYLTPDHLAPLYRAVNSLNGTSQQAGVSVKGESIDLITLGNGPVRVLMWSQMHGNESTTTRALADFIEFLYKYEAARAFFLERCTLYIIPVLNPDGARAYTRINAAGTDLNRDAQDLSQPESRVLREVFNKVDPHYCLNLHDQRTIFSAGPSDKPATVSFLSPAYNPEREINAPREVSMQIIAGVNSFLQEMIPGQVGRYDDGFNLNCVGDTFMSLGVPTILFESGHYQNDYNRKHTRKYIALALCAALEIITVKGYTAFSREDYFSIPENEKLFCDLIIRGVLIKNGEDAAPADLCYMYREVLEEGVVNFVLEFDQQVAPGTLFGHKIRYCEPSVTFDSESGVGLHEFANDLRKRVS